jgi:hypothetical protein
MYLRRSGFCILCFLLFSPLTVEAQVDYILGNIRIEVEDYNGAISLYRKITPVIDAKTAEEDTDQKIIKTKQYKGAAGTKFGVLPESSYVIPNKENNIDFYWKPLLDSGRYTSNSAYYVILDSGIYKLNRSAAIAISSSIDTENNNVIVDYELKNKVKVSVVMHVFASRSDEASDSIRVEVIIQNLSKNRTRIALKGIFDTYLGETTATHFTAVAHDVINSETLFDTMADEKWICSQNSIAGIKFLLAGNTITNPQNVIMSNKEVFSSQLWIPNVKTGRRFDSLFSYNNSALSIIWNPIYLDFDKSSTVRFYITTAEQGEKPSELFTNMEDLTAFSDVGVESGALRVVDQEYVARLLQYINQLKNNPKKADPGEIKYLTTEVENILQQMGQ